MTRILGAIIALAVSTVAMADGVDDLASSINNGVCKKMYSPKSEAGTLCLTCAVMGAETAAACLNRGKGQAACEQALKNEFRSCMQEAGLSN
jgi:hypothetical protein